MPRILVLTTLPHSRPDTHRIDRVNGRYSLRLEAPRSVGLPYGSYPRLILAWLTTQAVWTKNPEVSLGQSLNDFIRTLDLSPISGPRGTSRRLQEQLRRLCATRLTWHTSMGLHQTASGSGFVTSGGASWLRLAQGLLSRRTEWRSEVVLGQAFFNEITRSAVPVDLKAIHRLKGSPFAIDLYIWLTYRMSYLRKPTVVPWEGLRGQFGADYSRPRDFRREALDRLVEVLRVYPTARIGQNDTGLVLYPSPPHVQRRPQRSSELSSPRAVASVGYRSVSTTRC